MGNVNLRNMKIKDILNYSRLSVILILFSTIPFSFSACNEEKNEIEQIEHNNTEKPTIEVLTSATSTSELRVAFKTTGGVENIVTLQYGYSEDNLTKSTTCSYYNGTRTHQYYRGLVVGLDRGDRIYYKGIVKNNAGTAETSIYSQRVN